MNEIYHYISGKIEGNLFCDTYVENYGSDPMPPDVLNISVKWSTSNRLLNVHGSQLRGFFRRLDYEDNDLSITELG